MTFAFAISPDLVTIKICFFFHILPAPPTDVPARIGMLYAANS